MQYTTRELTVNGGIVRESTTAGGLLALGKTHTEIENGNGKRNHCGNQRRLCDEHRHFQVNVDKSMPEGNGERLIPPDNAAPPSPSKPTPLTMSAL